MTEEFGDDPSSDDDDAVEEEEEEEEEPVVFARPKSSGIKRPAGNDSARTNIKISKVSDPVRHLLDIPLRQFHICDVE